VFRSGKESSETLVYHGVTPEVFERLRKRLGAVGIEAPDGPHGRLAAFGVAGEYFWDESEEALEIRITDKPFLLPHHLIVGYFREAIQEAGGLPS
jgi:hypothetical protein